MNRYLRKLRNRKNSEPEELPAERPLSITQLTGATNFVRRVIFLAEKNLVVAASDDDSVRVYDVDTSGEPCTVFQGHNYCGVRDVAQLDSDLVASVGGDNRLFTWRATTAEMVGEWMHDTELWSVAKLGDSKIIVGDNKGNVLVLTHQSASSFQLHRRLNDSHLDGVNAIIVHADLFVTCSRDSKAKVWDTDSLALRATLAHDFWVNSAAVSDRNIVTTCGQIISVFQNGHDFHKLFYLSIEYGLQEISFLNDDIVAVAQENHFFFISLRSDWRVPSKSVLSRKRMEDIVESFAVLSDGRIAVAGGYSNRGYCAIVTPPKSVQGLVENCIVSLYPLSTFARTRAPLQAAWFAVQKQRLSLAEACKTTITLENCARSLGDWCTAHNLLMQAVKSGDIPASRHLHYSIAHWYQVLYQHGAKLAMGEKCIGGMKLLFKEAEDAGVIAKGQIEGLISDIGIRRDMNADNRFLVHATYQMFMRQAEMDVRLREVLHYQRVQQVAAMFNALIGCIPVGGAIVTNVVSGGASILNDMEVCGLVESVLGIGKDLTSGFASDSLVDRVLRRSNAALSVEEWINVPEEKRKVVEDVAYNLGLSIDELREKLQIVAAKQVDEHGKLSEQVVIEEVDEETTIQPVIPPTDLPEGAASISVESVGVENTGPAASSATTTGSPNRDECELKRWEEKGVSKDVIGPLKGSEAAICFAAFILNYECHSDDEFPKLKETMKDVFKKKRIYGETFVDADEEERKVLIDVLMDVLADVTDEDAFVLTKMWVKKFVRLASQ